MKKCIIAGGGFKGIASAYLLAMAGHKVTLVEKAPFLGGIMHSREWNGFFVDNGTHTLQSLQPDLADVVEDIMGGDLLPAEVNAGSVNNGVTTHGFALPDLSYLPRAVQQTILYEVWQQACVDETEHYGSLWEYFVARYGETAAGYFDESMSHIYRVSTREMDVEAVRQTSFVRLRFLPDEMMLVLKSANPVFDQRLAAKRQQLSDAPTLHDPTSQTISVYPGGRRGMRGFCEKAHSKLLELGVEIKLKESIESIDNSDDGVKVELGSGSSVKADHLVWSLDPGALSKAWTGTDAISQLVKPVPMCVYSFATDVERIYDCTYLQQFTPGALVYRAAAAGRYSGQTTAEGKSFITCEVPADVGSAKWEDAEQNATAVWQECIDMGLISGDAPPDAFDVIRAKSTFKMPLRGYTKACDELQESVAKTNGQILLPDRNAFTRAEIFQSVRMAIESLISVQRPSHSSSLATA